MVAPVTLRGGARRAALGLDAEGMVVRCDAEGGVGRLKQGGQGSRLVLGKVGAARGFRADSVARAGKMGGGRQDRQVGPGA